VKGPSPQRLRNFVALQLGLKDYLRRPGDGRVRPRIPAQTLVWALLLSHILRRCSFLGVESLVHSSARRAMRVSQSFRDDTLDYFTERVEAAATRAALAAVVRQAKRNKAFDRCRFIGLAVDGTAAGRSRDKHCDLCRPYRDQDGEVAGYRHHAVMASVVGTGLTLPLDVEPYGPKDSEYAAAKRLLKRVVQALGPRFAQYVVGDSEYATAPFLHAAGELGLRVVARLKANLPELLAQVEKRFLKRRPSSTFTAGKDRVELWDADDFDPWETLQWTTVRVVRYRQHRPDGSVIQAQWLTDFPRKTVPAESIYYLAKSRWEIENQGFNDAKNRYGMEHICHHHQNSVLSVWLLMALALSIERLYRLRHLHRGSHPRRSAAELVQLLWLSLSRKPRADSS
jgi:Transposase DDE domain